METTITVAAVFPPKEGKSRSTMKSTTGAMIGFFSDKLSPVVGRTYRLLVEEREFQGRTYLTASRVIEEVQLPPPTGSSSGAYGGNAVMTIGGAPDRFWLPCVSNVVAHAIQAGFIDDPLKIKVWAAAAKEALTELDQPPKSTAKSDADDQPPF